MLTNKKYHKKITTIDTSIQLVMPLDCEILVNGKKAKITAVENYGATDILVFELDGAEMQIPFVLDFFDNIDIQNKTLVASEHFFEGAV